MKFLKFLLMMLIIVGGLGYGVYFFGNEFVSDKITDSIAADIEDDENLTEIKAVVNDIPEIKQFIEEGAAIDESNLPFSTKEEAIKTVVQKIGFKELQQIQTKIESGISESEIQELLKEIEGKLTEEEILALKAVAYKELIK